MSKVVDPRTLAKKCEHAVRAEKNGQLEKAVRLYRQVIQAAPGHAQPHKQLAALYCRLGRQEDAIPLMKHALDLQPGDSMGWFNLGQIHQAMWMWDEALDAFDRSAAIMPDMPTTHAVRAECLLRLGHGQQAIDALKQAIALAEAHIRTGSDTPVPQHMAVALAADWYNNLGIAHQQQGQIEDAVRCHQKACALNPGHTVARSNLARDYNFLPDVPHEKVVDAHAQWWVHHAGNITPLPHRNDRSPDRPLRVGWLSGDFCEHAVAYFLLPLFEHLDPAQFELYSYSSVTHPDEFTRRFASRSKAFRSTHGATDAALAKQIQDDQIDILIDLAGHTTGNRLAVMAHTPAPVQVSYLGYPMTTGAPASVIHWRLTDGICDPEGDADTHYTEKLWRLPKTNWCYQPPIDLPCPGEPPVTRQPDTRFTFGSFNNISKLSDATVAMWSRILAGVPASRLMLKSYALADGSLRASLIDRFADQGIGADRLELVADRHTLGEHLQYYGHVDLALDTHPYNGTTTTCDALWMGVPTLTLTGDRHISRVASSLLTNAGLPELVAASEDDYIRTATHYATHHDDLAALRRGLRERLEQSPVMDAASFAVDFSAALRGMWTAWCTTAG